MNKKTIGYLLFILSFFYFSCGVSDSPAAKKKTEVSVKTDPGVASIIPVAHQDSLHRQVAARYKKRACCVGAPTRFKTSVRSVAVKN